MHGVDSEGPHARSSTRFLTGVPSKPDNGSDLLAAVSADQIAGRVLGRQTQLATLELAIDGRDFAGSCDDGFSCAYTNTIAWANETTPLPMEIDPRVVFERLFGDSGSTDPAVRRRPASARDASLLDSVTEAGHAPSPGKSDPMTSVKLGAVPGGPSRDIERRIQMGRGAERPRAARDRTSPPASRPPSVNTPG